MLAEDSMVFGREVQILRERNPNGPTILAHLRLAARRPIRSWHRHSRPGHHSVVDSQRNPSILSWCKKPGVQLTRVSVCTNAMIQDNILKTASPIGNFSLSALGFSCGCRKTISLHCQHLTTRDAVKSRGAFLLDARGVASELCFWFLMCA